LFQVVTIRHHLAFMVIDAANSPKRKKSLSFLPNFQMSMKLQSRWLSIICLFLSIAACQPTPPRLIRPDHRYLSYMGRIDRFPDGNVALISSAALVTAHVSGENCTVYLKNDAPAGQHNFASFDLNGKYLGRYRVDSDSVKSYPVKIPEGQKDNTLTIYKATEASNGNVIFTGISGKILKPVKAINQKYIEFIGNSITCGMGVEYDEIPCGTGQWYDQHNACWSYGAIIARTLNVRFMLSSVSGIGIYRNWNSDGPAMPDVYQNRYLDTDTTKLWEFSSPAPDVVSICLGTNDFSDGDGTKVRQPFDEERFINGYISFILTIYGYYPNTKIALLSSPILSGDKRKALETCLLKIQQHFSQLPDPRDISTYFFNRTFSSGCSGHPDKNDQILMADLLLPFVSGLLED
jgi:hypothetical protein